MNWLIDLIYKLKGDGVAKHNHYDPLKSADENIAMNDIETEKKHYFDVAKGYGYLSDTDKATLKAGTTRVEIAWCEYSADGSGNMAADLWELKYHFKDQPGVHCFDYVMVRVSPNELGLEMSNMIEE